MNQNKKVLILAYDFPPYVSVGGLRPSSWSKYFHENNIEPTVITRQWENTFKDERDYINFSKLNDNVVEQTSKCTIYRTKYKPNLSNLLYLRFGKEKFQFLRKFFSGTLEILQFFILVGTKKEIYKCALELCEKERFDLIIATGDPFVLFHYASRLGKKYNIPWIADYRDPWSQNLRIHKNGLLRTIELFIEKKTVKSAQLITTVNHRFKFQLSTLFQHIPIHIIENGSDLDYHSKKIESKSITKIGFIGSIQKEDPILDLIELLKEINHQSKKIELVLIGTNYLEIFNETYDFIHLIPKTNHEEIKTKLDQIDALVLFSYFDILGTKIYDYIAIQKPILFLYNSDYFPDYFKIKDSTYIPKMEQLDLLLKSKLGIICKNKSDLKFILENLETSINETLNRLDSHPIDSTLYSRQHQTALLANLIHEVIEKNKKQ